MRRHALLLCLCILLLATGCAPAEPSPQPTPTPTSDAPPPQTSLSPVAILVIDDFHPADQPRQDEPPVGGNCPVTPDGQGHFSGGGLGHFSGGGLGHFSGGGLGPLANTPHGALVYGKLRELIAASYGTPTTDIPDASNVNSDLRAVTIWPAEGQELVLVGVDSRGLNTTILAGLVSKAMSDVTAKWSARRFVLNMSFGLIPCDEGAGMTADDYRRLLEGEAAAVRAEAVSDESKTPRDSLRELVAELDQLRAERVIDPETADSIFIGRARALIFHEKGAEEVFATTTNQGNDVLFQLTQQLSAPASSAARAELLGGLPDAAIIVAAAGNSDLSFPFAPAMWPGVLAVGAEPEYANDSEVIMPDRYTLPGTAITIEGTSFAAPEMSFLAAVHLLRGGAADCFGASGATHPPLSYADETGPWLNLDLATASNDYCDPFP